MSTYRFSIDVPVVNVWDNVERLRGVVEACFESVFHDLEGRDAIAMVTGELLENAIKYGDWSHGRGVFRLRVVGDETGCTIAVTNPIAAGADGRVREVLSFLTQKASPLEAYQARLMEVATRPEDSGLGLLRVAYEGGCRLRCAVEGNELTVTAERRRPMALEAAPLPS